MNNRSRNKSKTKKEANNASRSKSKKVEEKPKENVKEKPKENVKEKRNVENNVAKRESTYRDKKIEESFLSSNKTRVALNPSKSKPKSKPKLKQIEQQEEFINSRNVKRSREERSGSKQKVSKTVKKGKKEESSEESSEEDLPKSAKIKTVKVEKKNKREEDPVETEEVEVEKTSKRKNAKNVKNSKSKGMIIDDIEEDEEIQPRAKSVPSKKKKGKKEESESEESESEDEDEDDDNEEVSPVKTKKTKKQPAMPRKKVKKYTKARKGKFNPNVEILSSCKYMESKEQVLYTDCCVHCNNRNAFRAANTGNMQLLKKCLLASQQISTLCDIWSKDHPLSALDLAISRGDKPMITEILNFLIKPDDINKKRVYKPHHKLSIIETGENNAMAYGVKTRQLNMTRGNREGNNAFLEEKEFEHRNAIVKSIIAHSKDGKMIDYINAILTNPLQSNNSTGRTNFEIDFNISLPQAIREGNRGVAHHLLGRINKSNALNNYGYNQLHFLVLDKKDDDFEVSHKSSLNKKSIGIAVITPVHVACINPNEKILKKLIELGADWHFLDDLHRKPIHYAAACEGSGPLKLLLNSGAHVDEPDRTKVTPLMIAAQCGRLDNVKLLVKSNANVLQKNKGGNMALHEAAIRGHTQIVSFLIEEGGIKVDQPGKDRMTPLMMAAANGHKDLVEALIELGAKVTKKDKFKRTPLLLSCKSGQSVIASILLRNGSDYNLPDSSSNSPLHYACAYGWISIVELLLQAGADVNSTNMWKISPLEVAMLKNHFGVVKYLLNNSQVNVNMKFDKGNTLLHHCFKGITNKSVEEIEYLINEKKADPNIQNLEGKSTLHLLAEFVFSQYIPNYDASSKPRRNCRLNFYNNPNDIDEEDLDEEVKNEENRHRDAHRLLVKTLFNNLISNGALIDLKTINGKTPLQIALELKNVPFIDEIMNSSPDILFIDSTGKTVLHLLSEFLFTDEAEEISGKILDRLVTIENVSLIVNSLDDEGLTPLLRLLHKYSKGVKGFYDMIGVREVYKYKTKVYELNFRKEDEAHKAVNAINTGNTVTEFTFKSLQNNNNNLTSLGGPFMQGLPIQNLAMPVFDNNNINIDLGNNLAGTSFMPLLGNNNNNTFPNLRKLGTEFQPFGTGTQPSFPLRPKIKKRNFTHGGALQADEMTRHEKIMEVQLTPEDLEIAKDKSRGVFFKRLDSSFNNLVYSFVKLGCDVRAQVQKLKMWREKSKEGEVKEINDDQKQQNHSNPFGMNNFMFNNNNSSNTLNKTSNNLITYKRKKMPQKKDPLNQQTIKQRKHNIADEYLAGIGNANILMLLMAFPSTNLIDYFINDLKIDVNTLDIHNKNALFYLIKNYEMIINILPEAFSISLDTLLKFKIKINQFDKENNSAFFLLSKLWAFDDMVKLSQLEADVNHSNKSGENALIYYIRKKEKTKVHQLLDNFLIDINYRDDTMRTAMHYLYNDEDATADIDVSFKKILLFRNPEVNARDISGRTPLHYLFVKIGKELDNSVLDPIVSLSTLLDIKGIEVDVQDIYGNTPLHYASQRGSTICAMALIQRSDINKKNYEGNTPLAYSLLFEQPSFAITLVQEKANFFDSAFPVKERIEKDLIRKMRGKKPKRLSNNSAVQNDGLDESEKYFPDEDLKTDSEEEEKLDISDSIFDYGNRRLGFNPIQNGFPQKAYPQFPNQTYPQCSNPIFGSESTKLLNNKFFVTPEEIEKGISLFRLCVKNNYQGLTYLLVNNKYDLMRAIQDSFYENKFNLAMLLLDKSPYDEVYRQVNEKGQNLFHILAMFGKSVLVKSDLSLFFEKLTEKGISLLEQDALGYTPLHYSCENRFKELCEYILSKTDPIAINRIVTKLGFTPFICAIKGKDLHHCEYYIDLLVNYVDTWQISLPYLEDVYGEGYKCSPILHFARKYSEECTSVEPIHSMEVKGIMKLLQKGANVMEKDSLSKDCLMYCVKENNLKLLELLVNNCRNQIHYGAVDSEGRSLIHYAVSPTEEGSYENEALLTFLLTSGFVASKPDKHGRTPIDYAKEQETGVNLRVFKSFNIAPHNSKVLRRKNSIISEWPKNIFNIEEDVEKLYQSMIQNATKREEIVMMPDSLGNFALDTHSLIKDSNGYWDATMTKVKVGAGLYGEYNFYKMQLIHDKGRDIFILFNRFGRIGESGQHQRTPFNSLEEAQAEFKKIFKDKSGNEWGNKSNFQRVKGKYMLLHFSQFKLSHKELLESFDFKKSPDSSIRQREVRSLLKELTDSTIYVKALEESGIDTELFNFNYLNKELLYKARTTLGEINQIRQEITLVMSTRGPDGLHSEDAVDKVLEHKSRIYELSSRYYELIPKTEFKTSVVRALDNDSDLHRETMLLDNLTYVENAVKILLGAQLRQKEVNPLDYCLNALNIQIEMMNKESNEFSLLKSYITTNSHSKLKNLNIFKIQRKGEAEQILKWKSASNHMLLFHGSKVFNFIGILSNGLKIAPPEAPSTGLMFGKGVYFADLFDKSLSYCDLWDSEEKKNKSHKYMLMCEVALGNTFEASQSNQFEDEQSLLNKGFNSLKALASQGPNPNCKFVMNNGVQIPLGRAINYNNAEKWNESIVSSPEYVVYDSSQIRIRYLIQIDEEGYSIY